jgi:hypothetical protein
MATITVGAGKNFATLAAAIGASTAGDTILVDAGTYTDDFATITHKLTIQGVGGMAKLVAASAPGNGKAILVAQADLTIDHLEFEGAHVPDGNGAGIRYESGALVITSSWFHGNENGILAAANAAGSITIDHSEFNDNGTGTGFTHNLYVGEIASLVVTNSLFMDTHGGHHIKSRAHETVVTGNRFVDGPAVGASYVVDVPDGGAVTISANVMMKGPAAQNRTFIHLGGERSPSYDNTSLSVTGNQVVNLMASGPPVLVRNDSMVGGANVAAQVSGNTLWNIGASEVLVGLGSLLSNQFEVGAGPVIDLSAPFLPEPVACFRAGTRLTTPDGPVAVEDLDPGDLVVTGFGTALPVRWVGHRTLHCGRHARPWDVMPVRVAVGAFRPGAPSRDLWLSPDHALFVDGVLIPVRYLLNGVTVVQEAADEVTYFHVEVEGPEGTAVHSVVLAEGLPAETYLDTGNRAAFANGGAVMQADPDFALDIWKRAGMAPLVLDGPRLRAVRHRLALRAIALGFRLVNDPCLVLEVDGAVVPQRPSSGAAVFDLPRGARVAMLRSRSFVPAHVIPGSDDHRVLGVGVTALSLDGQAVDLAGLGTGWHPAEAGLRWTDGAGRLDVQGARLLVVEAGVPGLYWEQADPPVAAARPIVVPLAI